jgi:hypothetical protein
LGEGKTFQKKNGGDGFQRNLGEVRESWIFFSCALRKGHLFSWLERLIWIERKLDEEI